jgi:type IV pilus assembly protein PilC
MAVFAYKAKSTQTGRVEAGTVEAENQQIAIRTLREQGFWVTDIKQQKGAKAARKPGGGFRLFKRVGLRHLAIFCRQFSTMINAGVSLVRCLDVLEQQTSSAALREIIQDITTEIEGGATLSRAMSKYPRVFSNLAIGLVRAGEVGGVLDESLDRLASFLESDMNLRRKVKSAMTYPIIVVFVALGIVTFLVTFILPKFMKLFEDLGVKEFPVMTTMLMNASHFITQKWWLCIIIAVAFTAVFRRLIRTRLGKRYWDIVKLKVPVFGGLNRRIALARFSRTLSTLLSSGVPILQAMETVAGAVDNEIISDAILASRASIREGDTIAAPLAESHQFPPMVVQMIAIGEETGSLDSMLAKVADFYEAEVEAQLESLTAALEPVMIVMLGFMVGFIVISMFMPLLSVITNLSQ